MRCVIIGETLSVWFETMWFGRKLWKGICGNGNAIRSSSLPPEHRLLKDNIVLTVSGSKSLKYVVYYFIVSSL